MRRLRTPDHVLRLQQEGDLDAILRDELAAVAELAEEAGQDDLAEVLTGAVEALDEALEDEAEEGDDGEEDDVEAQQNRRPTSSEYESLEEFRAALKAWRRRKARSAPRRASTPSVVTREPDDT